MRLISVLPPALLALLLTGCSTADPVDSTDDGTLSVVASANVWGDIASQIGGDAVRVTSIVDDPSVDPHSFEGSARVQLELSRADIVIVNGGGYDDWASTLLAGADNEDATVLNAVGLSGYGSADTVNEHVWYDFPTVRKVAHAIAGAIEDADPAASGEVESNLSAFDATVADLEIRAAAIATTASGAGVAITEPVPGYLLEAVGLDTVTPAEFSEAIEEGTDVSPLVLQQTIRLITDGSVELLVYNEQTTSAETEKVLDAARTAGVPTVAVTETEPADTSYGDWMGANIDAISAALAG